MVLKRGVNETRPYFGAGRTSIGALVVVTVGALVTVIAGSPGITYPGPRTALTTAFTGFSMYLRNGPG